MTKLWILWAVLLGNFGAQAAPVVDHYARRIDDIAKIRTKLGLDQYYFQPGKIANVKVAVIDSGFDGLYPKSQAPSKYLPDSVEVVAEYPGQETDSLDSSAHGRYMAQIIWAVASGSGKGPTMRLLNGASPENFVKATEEAIRWGADLVVCAVNWHSMGNFDGTGFIDKTVNAAVKEGIIWLQAAGNHGRMVYNGRVKLDSEKTGLMFGEAHYLRVKNNVDDNELDITLSWNDFDPSRKIVGQDRDLRICLYSAGDKPTDAPTKIACSTQHQVVKVAGPKDTLFARDHLVVKHLPLMKDKHYLLAAFVDSGNFSERDRVRVTVISKKGSFQDAENQNRTVEAIEFLDATKEMELGVPADGQGLTIGDLSSETAIGPTLDGRLKPEILMELNQVTFGTKDNVTGTSFATALLGGVVAVLKAVEPNLKQHHLLKFSQLMPRTHFDSKGWDISRARFPFADSSRKIIERSLGTEWGVGKTVANRGIAVLDSFNKLTDLPAAVKKSPQDYQAYLQENHWQTTEAVKKTRYVRVMTKAGGTINHERYWKDTGEVTKRWTTTYPPEYDSVPQYYWENETIWKVETKLVAYPSADSVPKDVDKTTQKVLYHRLWLVEVPRAYTKSPEARGNVWFTPPSLQTLKDTAKE